MKKILLVAIATFTLVSCASTSKIDENIHELVDSYMFNNLPSYPDYQEIQTTIDDFNYNYIGDGYMMALGAELVNLDRSKKVMKVNDYEDKWNEIMFAIYVHINETDTNEQVGYIVTQKYRCTNHIGAYVINTDRFVVNLHCDSIWVYEDPSQYDAMVNDVYLKAAITMLQDAEFIKVLTENKTE